MLLSGKVQSEYVAVGEGFKQQYYRNINNLRLCMPLLLSGNVQSENIAAEESVQTTILLEP